MMSTRRVTITAQSNKYKTKVQNIQTTRVNRSQLLLKSIASTPPPPPKKKDSDIDSINNGTSVEIVLKSPLYMMTSSNENIFGVNGRLGGKSTGHWWIPFTKASDAELWYFYIRMNKQLSKQLRRWWFETPSRSFWRHCNESINMIHIFHPNIMTHTCQIKHWHAFRLSIVMRNAVGLWYPTLWWLPAINIDWWRPLSYTQTGWIAITHFSDF